MRDKGPTEIGGFGISPKDDFLYVEDFELIPQIANPMWNRFSDEAISDYFEDQADLDRHPNQFARIWCHTHPGNSAHPSGMDEKTFEDSFGDCDWAVMFILARGGQCYARMNFNGVFRGQVEIPVTVEHPLMVRPDWDTEFKNKVTVQKIVKPKGITRYVDGKILTPAGSGSFGAIEHSDGDGDRDWGRWEADCAAIVGDGDTDDPFNRL